MPPKALIIWISMIFVAAACGGGFDHPGSLHTESQLAHVRKMISGQREPWNSAYRGFLVHAEASLTEESSARPTISIAPYYENPQAHRDDSLGIARDARAAYTLALAYQLNGDVRFADKAVELLNAWSICTTLGNTEAELVVAYAGNGLILAADLMYSYRGWRKDDRSRFIDGFVGRAFADATTIKERRNNWGDWGTFGALAMYHLLEDERAFQIEVERLKRRIVDSIEEDGRMPLEIERDDRGLWYTYFALSPMTAACSVVLNHSGEDLFAFRDARIKKACDHLLTWLVDPGDQLKWDNWSDFYGRSLLELRARNLFEAMHDVYGDEHYDSWITSENGRPVEDPLGHHNAWVYPTLMKQRQQPTR
jgi:hypothetical protein